MLNARFGQSGGEVLGAVTGAGFKKRACDLVSDLLVCVVGDFLIGDFAVGGGKVQLRTAQALGI